MEQNKDSIFPTIDIFPRITKVAKFLNRLVFGPHLKWQNDPHPFDRELYDKQTFVYPLESDGVES